MIIIALATVLPFFTVNLSYQPTLKYYSRLLDHEYPRSESGMVSLLHHYRRIGDDRAGDSLNVIIRQTYARSQMEEKSLALADDGRYDEALRIADSMHQADPYSSNPYNIKGMIYFFKKDYPKAILEFEQALRLTPQAYRILVNLALTYHRQGQPDKLMSVLRRAQRLAPEYNKLYEAFAMGFFTKEQYDSSLVYARYLIESDPQNEGGYLIAGVSHYKFREFEQAEVYLEQYLSLDPEGEERQIAQRILKIIQENKNIP
jgi:tetratricopeptide (TPR) repeat protein